MNRINQSERDDRRVFARYPAEFSLLFLNLLENEEGKAVTFDVSAKGIGILSKQELHAHTAIEIWLRVPDRSEPLYTRGEVVWSNKISPSNYRIGINLEKADLIEISRLLGGMQ